MARPTVSIESRFRIHFALQYAAIGILMPYVALYLDSIGLTGGQIGLLLALLPLIGFLVQPFWGFLSDVQHLHRRALILACLGVFVSMIGFASTRDFRLLLLFSIIHAIMKAPIGILSTALALEQLERGSGQAGFGSVRLWGSIGFAIASFAVGAWLVPELIWWILPLYALTHLGLAVVSMTVPDAEIHGEVRWQEGLFLLRQEPVLVGFLLGCLLVGFTLGIVNNYLAVYLADINAAGWVIGTALAVSALFEVPLMASVPEFVGRWGIRLVLVAGIAVLPLRWLLYVFIERPIWVVPTQVLHSIAMTSLLVVGVIYVDRLHTAKWRASGQALYAASLHGVGPSIGMLAAGLIYEQAGITPVWLLCFFVSLVGTTIIGLVVYRHPASRPQEEVVL